jgi:hypothetical protein
MPSEIIEQVRAKTAEIVAEAKARRELARRQDAEFNEVEGDPTDVIIPLITDST